MLGAARDALALLVRAHVAARDPDADAEQVAHVVPAEELPRICEGDRAPPLGWERTLAVVGAESPIVLDRLGREDAEAIAGAAIRTARWLKARLETRSVTHLRALRRGRLAAIFVLLVYVVYLFVAPKNLARNKPVTQSSALPGAPPSSVLVDGESDGAIGPAVPGADYVHTNHEAAPWVRIDLLASHAITEVRVYNRNDTNFDDGLPFTLELSEDGDHFEAVATRETHFGTTRFDRPWVIKLPGKPARFVRVRATHYLALSEVEVFGR